MKLYNHSNTLYHPLPPIPLNARYDTLINLTMLPSSLFTLKCTYVWLLPAHYIAVWLLLFFIISTIIKEKESYLCNDKICTYIFSQKNKLKSVLYFINAAISTSGNKLQASIDLVSAQVPCQ